jgi:fructuronate reductase
VRRHLADAAATLPAMPDMDLTNYCIELIKRFSNLNIAHETFQIAADGSEKVPQRIFAPAVDAINANHSVRSFAFATAVWIRFCRLDKNQENYHEIVDPRAEQLKAAAQRDDPDQILSGFEEIPGLFPKELILSITWRREVLSLLEEMIATAPQQVIETECRNFC